MLAPWGCQKKKKNRRALPLPSTRLFCVPSLRSAVFFFAAVTRNGMHQPRLHSSQELTLHQINVDQTYQSREGDGRAFPSCPSSSYPPLVAAGMSASGASTGEVGNSAGAGGGLPSPSFVGGTPLAQTPGGSSSTATASIIRPDVRHRSEWATALDDVELFGLPGDRFLCSREEGAATAVRYIADDYDRLWLAQRLDQYGSDLGDGLGRGGKTGMLGSPPPTTTARHPRSGAPLVSSEIGISLLEDIITAFELAAYYNPEIPLERLNGVDGLYLENVAASAAAIADVRQYWLWKRESLGGHISCIPALMVHVREDNQRELCHPEILGDCPLPFKSRDWMVPAIHRKRRRRDSHERADSADLGHTVSAPQREGPCQEYLRLARLAVELSAAVLNRERLRRDHTRLSLYELACLRALGDRTSSVPCPRGEPFEGNADSPFARSDDPVSLEVQSALSALAHAPAFGEAASPPECP